MVAGLAIALPIVLAFIGIVMAPSHLSAVSIWLWVAAFAATD